MSETILSKKNIAQLRRGNREVFELIYKEYYNVLKGYVFKIVKIEEEAEDIVHDVFFNVWQNREEIDSDRKFFNYLYTIAKNLSLNYLRGESVKRKHKNSIKHSENLSAEIEESYDAKKMKVFLLTKISEMPKERQEVFKLSRMEEKNVKEIAELLGISQNTVYYHLNNAVDDLKEHLKVSFDFECKT